MPCWLRGLSCRLWTATCSVGVWRMFLTYFDLRVSDRRRVNLWFTSLRPHIGSSLTLLNYGFSRVNYSRLPRWLPYTFTLPCSFYSALLNMIACVCVCVCMSWDERCRAGGDSIWISACCEEKVFPGSHQGTPSHTHTNIYIDLYVCSHSGA